MTESTVWWLLTGAAVALELVTGTFYLLMLAIGLAAGAVAAHLGATLPQQLVAAAVLGGGAVLLWQKRRSQAPAAPPAQANPDVNLDIGQTIQVKHWAPDGTAHTHYRGADWSVILATPAPDASPGTYRIVAIQGSRLVVQAL